VPPAAQFDPDGEPRIDFLSGEKIRPDTATHLSSKDCLAGETTREILAPVPNFDVRDATTWVTNVEET
jgi:hypothetical protein